MIGTAAVSASIAAALASPTFGLNISFNAGESTILYLHDAEDADAGGANPTNFRNLAVSGNQIPFGSAPGYQMGSGSVAQFGGAGTGSSQGKIGIGHVEDIRTTTMTVQSLSFVNQNEVNTADSSLKMNGNSLLSANFSLVWDATGVYGPNLVGRISIPAKATIVGDGSAFVKLDNVKWQVDRAGGDVSYFDVRAPFTGQIAFEDPGTFSKTLTSTSLLLKNPDGTALTMNPGDKFRLSGTLTFLADGNSPADTQFLFSDLTDYQNAVLSKAPLRYYRFEETSIDQQADDIGSTDTDGNYQGDVHVQQQTASFQLGHAARFSMPDILQVDRGPSINALNPAMVHAGNSGLDLQNTAFTAEAWVAREDNFGDGGFRSIIDNQTPSGMGWRLGMNDFAILFDGDTDLIVPFDSLPGEFYHIVAVADGMGGGEIFVNGISIGGGDFSLTSAGGGAFIIGAADNNIETQFVGLIDEVAIYQGAFAPTDVLNHFNIGRENGDLLPLMGIQIDESFVALPEPATVTLAMLALAGGSIVLGRRRRR